jgi:hypothetical protein
MLFQLPEAVHARLQLLLDCQDAGEVLTLLERQEAEGLVELAEFLSLLRLRSQRSTKQKKPVAETMAALESAVERVLMETGMTEDELVAALEPDNRLTAES